MVNRLHGMLNFKIQDASTHLLLVSKVRVDHLSTELYPKFPLRMGSYEDVRAMPMCDVEHQASTIGDNYHQLMFTFKTKTTSLILKVL